MQLDPSILHCLNRHKFWYNAMKPDRYQTKTHNKFGQPRNPKSVQFIITKNVKEVTIPAQYNHIGPRNDKGERFQTTMISPERKTSALVTKKVRHYV